MYNIDVSRDVVLDDISRMQDLNLVFDLGFHKGEDTGYYLAEGKSVVAVDASLELIQAGEFRFAEYIDSGQLILLHGAVVSTYFSGNNKTIKFYPHSERSEWGTVDLRWVNRNEEAHGLPHSDPVEVRTYCILELVRKYGCPSFLKIDIEGADASVLKDLENLPILPKTVSWETGKNSLKDVISQHKFLHKLGYSKFRVVQQAYLEHLPYALMKNGRRWHFEPGCSGYMPEKCSKPWISLKMACIVYIILFGAYKLFGPRSLFNQLSKSPDPCLSYLPLSIQHWCTQKRLPLPGWFDSHALLAE